MDYDFNSAINCPHDEFIPKTVVQDVGEHPELSILFKVKIHEGGPLPLFLLTTEAVSAICDETEVLRPTNISFLNEYEAVFKFPLEYDANRIMVSLQKIDTWFSFNMEVSWTVAGLDQLVNINKEQTGSKTTLTVEGKDIHTPDHQQIDQTLEQATQHIVDRVMDHVNTQVRYLESLMSEQSLDGGMQPRSHSANHHPGMGLVELQSDSPAIVNP